MELIDKITEISRNAAEKLNLKLYKVYFENQSDGRHLFIIVDKKEGVDLKTISDFTDLVNPELDNIEELNFPYYLECQSRGAEHEVEKAELPDYLNEYMQITTVDGRKVIGTLTALDDNQMTLTYFIKGRKKKETFALEKVNLIELRIKF